MANQTLKRIYIILFNVTEVLSAYDIQVIWWRNLEDWEEKFKAVSHNRARP